MEKSEISQKDWNYLRAIGREGWQQLKPKPQQRTPQVPDIDYPEGGAWKVVAPENLLSRHREAFYQEVGRFAKKEKFQRDEKFPLILFKSKKEENGNKEK